MSANIKPLQDAVKLVSDLVMDSVKAAGDSGASAKAMEFTNLLSDLLVLVPELGEIPAISSLQAPDYEALVASVASDLVLAGKAGAIVSASLKLLSDLAPIVSDVGGIITAAKS